MRTLLSEKTEKLIGGLGEKYIHYRKNNDFRIMGQTTLCDVGRIDRLRHRPVRKAGAK
ncbi:hypothetical protein BN2476_750130 [Paraburkholderia piptadeniae]|uniref:Uncharacterized protein n=1 Tax=Paraburkholderia piptadeniae TaxID=1701573 RepID=A0A1N7STB2_9BURK|nr:hypothetical protein BN2476_750130 [Paraburkholderia piptadeniae]